MSTTKAVRQKRRPRTTHVPVKPSPPRDKRPSADVADEASLASVAWYRRTWALSGLSCLLLWAALPPLNLWPLAWVAPVGWLLLIRREEGLSRREYLQLWLTGVAHWAVVLYGICLAHWANYFGLALLATYLGVYTPLFVGLSRVATKRMKLPLIVVGPVIWMAFEYARGYMFTGISLALLGHTQVTHVGLLQISDIAGAYGVSFLVMLVATCLFAALPSKTKRWQWQPLVVALVAVAATLAYGQYRLQQRTTANDAKSLKVALLQGNMDVQLGLEQSKARKLNRKWFAWHMEESRELCAEHPDLDAVVWAESMFTGYQGGSPRVVVTGEISAAEREHVAQLQAVFDMKCEEVASHINDAAGHEIGEGKITLIAGDATASTGPGGFNQFNSALMVTPDGRLSGDYDKMHPVLFGEYVPLARRLPFLVKISPIGQGLTPGDAPTTFDVNGLKLAPSICFESTVPHLIRRHYTTLANEQAAPDVLVNLTNDGWFWGSTILDLHFNCAVFRAIENRTPIVIAANTGFSAHIDGNGRVLAKSPRHAEDSLVVTVETDERASFYHSVGDWPWLCCLLATGFVAIFGIRRSRSQNAE